MNITIIQPFKITKKMSNCVENIKVNSFKLAIECLLIYSLIASFIAITSNLKV